MQSSINKISAQCELLSYALVITLVFEGILRKLVPPLSTPLFFLKDFLCLIGIFLIVRVRFSYVAKLKALWISVFFLFLPILFFTAYKDPVLSVFALKQYLLYVVTGILVIISFPPYKEQEFRKFIFFTSLLLIPTTIVGIIQNALPASHWLNLSVTGDSLKDFSAAGFLRVGSTFSFTGQYSWFLNAEAFFLATSFFMPPVFKRPMAHQFKAFVYSILAIMLIIGAFITGGRTAVLGCGSTLVLGLLLIGFKNRDWFLSKGVVIIFFCIVSLSVLRLLRPEFFKAFDERAAGTKDFPHNIEMTNRILDGFTGFNQWFWDQNAVAILIGNGLGIMSNGVTQVSSYAAEVRTNVIWTEGDVPTTFWEGGLYLALIWYGFRLFLIAMCYSMWGSLKNKNLAAAASAPLAYTLVQGVTAQFGLQPPLSIWWWFAIGIIFFIHRLDKFRIAQIKSHVE